MKAHKLDPQRHTPIVNFHEPIVYQYCSIPGCDTGGYRSRTCSLLAMYPTF